MVQLASGTGADGQAAGSAAADKKCRWRKDRKDAPEKEAAGAKVVLPAAPAVNQAAELAFKGLHGAKTQFSLIAGATDNVYRSVLGGNAYYYQELLCRSDDFSIFEALVEELEYTPHWMYGGTPLYRPTALGTADALRSSPTYERVVRWLAGHFGVEPIRSISNFYRNGDDFTSPHSDQYFDGVNMTIGASFGEERALVFEHRESKEQFSFPQHNGDIFAFTDEVNRTFTHSVPKERRRAHSTSRRHSPGRVSVIVWARRDQPHWKRDSSTLPLNLKPNSHIMDRDPKLAVVEDAEGDGEAARESEAAAVPTETAQADASSSEATVSAPLAAGGAADVAAGAPLARGRGRFAKSPAERATEAPGSSVADGANAKLSTAAAAGGYAVTQNTSVDAKVAGASAAAALPSGAAQLPRRPELAPGSKILAPTPARKEDFPSLAEASAMGTAGRGYGAQAASRVAAGGRGRGRSSR